MEIYNRDKVIFYLLIIVCFMPFFLLFICISAELKIQRDIYCKKFIFHNQGYIFYRRWIYV